MLKVNKDACIGCGACQALVSDVFDIDQFSKEYSRVFEGNTYIQYAAESDVIGARGVGINYSMYNHLTPESIATFLGDETGIAKLQE